MAVLSLFFGCSSPGFLPGSGRPMDGVSLHALIDGASRTNRVPATLVAAMVDAESHGDPSAVSRAGAQGIMQLMPATSLEYGVANPFDPRENIDGGTRYLHDLLRRYRGNVKFAVAAYNAGPGAVDLAHGIPPFPETRAYVARVLTAYTSR
jgi:soluble lytic murein transglycosylase-like protein